MFYQVVTHLPFLLLLGEDPIHVLVLFSDLDIEDAVGPLGLLGDEGEGALQTGEVGKMLLSELVDVWALLGDTTEILGWVPDEASLLRMRNVP